MKFLSKIRLAIHAFFWGLKSADKKMMAQVNNGGSSDAADEDVIDHAGSVWNELIQKQETERVAEFRDEQYRVYRESDHYQVDTTKLRFDENGNIDPTSVEIVKKGMLSLTPEGILLNNGDKLILEQLNLKVSVPSYEESTTEDNPLINTIKIDREYIPRFKVEDFTKKLVLKENKELEEGYLYFDLYCSKYRRALTVKGQGLKAFVDDSDIFFLQELKQILAGKLRRSDITDFDSIEFTTHKAYNADELLYYKLINCEYVSTVEYDGNYVLTFKGYPLCNGVDLIAKYHTESLDKKLETKEQRTDEFAMSEFTTNMITGTEED